MAGLWPGFGINFGSDARFRSRSSTDGYDTRYTVEQVNCPIAHFERWQPSEGKYEDIRDVVSPNFKSRSAQGEIIINAMRTEKKTYRLTTQVAVFTNPPYGWKMYGDFPVSEAYFLPWCEDPTDPEELCDLQSEANKCYGSVSSSTASLIVTLGELKETKKMLLGAVNNLYKVSQLLTNYELLQKQMKRIESGFPAPKRRKGQSIESYNKFLAKWNGKSGVADKLASAWLEVRYGWIPFISDIKALQKAFRLQNETKPPRQTFRTTWSKFFYRPPFTWPITDGGHVWTYSRTSQSLVKVRTGVIGVPRFNPVDDAFGLTKIPNALYDLTWMSFVCEWFFGVSDWLAAWTPDTYWRPEGSWHTIKQTIDQYVGSTRCEAFAPRTVAVSQPESIRRQISTTYRIPQALRSTLPRSRFNMNVKRYVDAVALSKQILLPALRRSFQSIKH